MKYIIDAKRKGQSVTCEVTPHSYEDKVNGAPGISGIETAFSVCYSYLVKEKEISLNKLSEIMSKNPAEIMKLNKGQIRSGKITYHLEKGEFKL